MSKLGGCTTTAVIVVVALVMVLASPLATIWAADCLFHAGWTQDLAHWGAVLWFELLIGGWAASAGSKRSA
jgi:hypothetical protein